MKLLDRLRGPAQSSESQDAIDTTAVVRAAVLEVKRARSEFRDVSDRAIALENKLAQHGNQLELIQTSIRAAEERKQTALAAHAEGLTDEKPVVTVRKELRDLSVRLVECKESMEAISATLQSLQQKTERGQVAVQAAELAFWRALTDDLIASAPAEVGEFLIRLRACHWAAQRNATFEQVLHQIWPGLRPLDVGDMTQTREELHNQFFN